MADQWLVLLALGLILAAGFLAGAETAFTWVSRVAIEQMVKEKKRGAGLALRVLPNPTRYLNVVLLVRKTLEFSAGVIFAVVMMDRFENRALALGLTVAIMVLLSYVAVGVGPRTLGRQNSAGWARFSAGPIIALATVLSPVTTILIAFGNALTPGKGFREGPFATEAELRDLLDQAQERGLVEHEESEMIHSVFELGDTFVRELMVPRTEMVWIEKNKTLRQALSLALRSGYSRIPVIGDGLDDVIGIAYVKDVAKRVHEHRDAEQNERIEQCMRAANFVPESKPADELLREMQHEQIHLAVVVDEYGGTAGLITIEDILEEIVGEITDEFDTEETSFEWINETRARVSARLHVEDLADEMDTTFDEDLIDGVDSIGGLMAKHLGRVPIPGSEIVLGGLRFTAESPVGRRKRIGTVVVERIEETEE